MLNKKAIQLFRWVSPSIDYNKKRWLKVHPIELNTIYEYRDALSLPIAIWTEFEGLSDARITRILKKLTRYRKCFSSSIITIGLGLDFS